MSLRAVIAVCVLTAIDQLTKFWSKTCLMPHESHPVLKGIFHLTLIENSGAAFGFFRQKTAVFIFIAAVAALLILFCAKRFRHASRWARIGLTLILAGTLGNLIDRIRTGRVTDFLDFRVWPVFNFADIFISLGGLFLVWHIIIFRKKDRNYKAL